MRVVELFAGVGGFRVGLEAVSKDYFQTVWANQWEPGKKTQFAFDCYDFHFESGTKVNADINTVLNQIPEHDLLVGGFPCQDYSVARTGAKGIEGKKGVLWWAINQIISSSKRPRYLFLENVDRLIRSPKKQRGRDFGVMLRCLADNGYYVEWRVINAADYGMPQKRRRVFIFAARNDQPFVRNLEGKSNENIVHETGFFARCFAIKAEYEPKSCFEYNLSTESFPDLLNVSDDFQAKFGNCGFMRGYRVYTRDCVADYDGKTVTLGKLLESDVGEQYYPPESAIPKWEYLKGAKRIPRIAPDGSTYMYSEGRISFPDRLDIAGRTMLTSEGTCNRSSHIIKDPTTGRLRILTPRECERLNGFPDDWTAGVMTERQRYFCMGNALVVPIITRMGETLMAIEGRCDI